MKQFVSIFSILLSANVLAGGREGVTPNLFHCEGPEATIVSYTTTSFTGQPTMSVNFKDHGHFTAQEIRLEHTGIGSLVSTDDDHLVPVDGPTVRYTLLLPFVQLNAKADPATFSTGVIRTPVSNPFMHAPLSQGSVQHNEFVDVACTAQRVFF